MALEPFLRWLDIFAMGLCFFLFLSPDTFFMVGGICFVNVILTPWRAVSATWSKNNHSCLIHGVLFRLHGLWMTGTCWLLCCVGGVMRVACYC